MTVSQLINNVGYYGYQWSKSKMQLRLILSIEIEYQWDRYSQRVLVMVAGLIFQHNAKSGLILCLWTVTNKGVLKLKYMELFIATQKDEDNTDARKVWLFKWTPQKDIEKQF